jgi:hypothetical protein
MQLVEEAYTIQQAWEEEKWSFLVSWKHSDGNQLHHRYQYPTATIDRASEPTEKSNSLDVN